MPIYEFHCEECDRSFELLVSLTAPSPPQCPHCQGGRLARELSVFASGSTGGESRPAGAGGCCGGGCGCGR